MSGLQTQHADIVLVVALGSLNAPVPKILIFALALPSKIQHNLQVKICILAWNFETH